MRFCDKCESYMVRTAKGFSCPRCGKFTITQTVEVKKMELYPSDRVYTVDNLVKEGAVRVNQTCPQCANHQAFYWISEVSGEHAGVKRERTVEHYRCIKCHYSWSKSH